MTNVCLAKKITDRHLPLQRRKSPTRIWASVFSTNRSVSMQTILLFMDLARSPSSIMVLFEEDQAHNQKKTCIHAYTPALLTDIFSVKQRISSQAF